MADKKTAPAATDLLAGINIAAPPMISSGNVRQPLGPPQAYYTEQAMFNPALAGFQPYVDGDEGTPGYSMSSDDRDRLKSRMNAAGLYGSEGYTSGSWNPDDARAYKYVLETANMMGQRDAEVVIDNLASEATKGARIQGPRAPLVSRVSNPDDIRAVLRETAYSLTGSRLSNEEEQRLISAYQATQGASNQAEYAAGGGAPGSTSTVTNAASPQSFAEAQIEQMRPGEVASHRHLDAFEKILGSMGSLASETPTYQGAGLPNDTGKVL